MWVARTSADFNCSFEYTISCLGVTAQPASLRQKQFLFSTRTLCQRLHTFETCLYRFFLVRRNLCSELHPEAILGDNRRFRGSGYKKTRWIDVLEGILQSWIVEYVRSNGRTWFSYFPRICGYCSNFRDWEIRVLFSKAFLAYYIITIDIENHIFWRGTDNKDISKYLHTQEKVWFINY